MNTKLTIYTIGHSTHPIDDFIAILKHYGITELIDIRTIAKSRHNPQFNGPDLAHALRNHHIGYHHLKKLGGLRHAHPDSINTAWRNASFRGFADYMQTDEFLAGLEQLIDIARHKQVAIMCAEAVPWRCHRSLIGDALLVRDIQVMDIFTKSSSKPHEMTPWAHVKGQQVTYPDEKNNK